MAAATGKCKAALDLVQASLRMMRVRYRPMTFVSIASEAPLCLGKDTRIHLFE
jgi:hypothetical protein